MGFAPGTGPDVVARTLGLKLSETLGQPVVVENRAGAGGQIAAQFVAKSPADGYTLLIADVSAISIAPAAFSKLAYDPARELVPVSEVVRTDFILVVPNSSPAKSVADFVKAARASKDKINFATFGAGTPGHFGAEMFAEQGGFKVEPVHFRATGDAVTGIIAGDVQAAFVSTALATAQVKGGKMRALATTAPQRSPLLPDVPTFTESGFPKADFSAWFCLFVPAGTPDAVVSALNAKVVAAVNAPEVRRQLEEAGFSILGTSTADAGKMVAAETVRWSKVVQATGFKGD
ncbi:tripartite tricarboxylate transporter substrate-binding protein [Variovorax sp. J22R24]|uniref:Bug family tripartite tricarboxylate transporter substrate binding protein n=1 Tax=Variovorax gracilis TaxID=3053502 RepID=UPI002575F8F0|nr:tripartite tricarboxylate transporter substrate-binding protein [Variovorax sp. J22R24]MDM0109252.1 tripartite tricarboxylate transporter substrate-binding protein [Variovorax sp. J22R24]